ncbi:MAG: ABC transporter substrate-binding protein [Vicinamibacterales bacterium]
MNGCARQPPATEALRIGVINSEKGQFEAFGRPVRDGLTMAADDINKAGGVGGRPIELVWEDDGSDPQRSAEAFQKLVDSKVLAIIGPISSDGTIATAPIAARSGIAQISPIAPRKGDADATRNTFLIYPSTVDAARAAIQTAVKRFKGNRIAVLHSEDNAMAAARETAGSLQANLVAAEKFSMGTRDFASQIKTIVAAKPDVIIYPSFFEEEAIQITTEMQAVASQFPDIIIIVVGAACIELLQSDVISNPALSRSLFVLNEAFGADLPDQGRMQGFVQQFRQRFSATPSTYAGAAHATMQILSDAISSAGEGVTSARLVETLRAGQYQTAFGDVRFNAQGINSAASFEVFKVTANKELQLAMD